MDAVLKDLRLASRMLRKTPGSTAIAVIALAMGVGLTALMFSILYGVIWRGLPFEESEELMFLENARVAEGDNSAPVFSHDFTDWRTLQRSFEELSAFTNRDFNVSGGDRPERYDGALITAAAFDILKVQPLLGRLFTEEDDRPGSAPVVVIGFNLWRDRFASDPGILGKTLRLNGQETTIIGVMPEGFQFPFREDLWVPFRLDPQTMPRGSGESVSVFGRLREGVSLDRAKLDFSAITDRLARDYPATNQGVSAVIKPYTREIIGNDEMAVLLSGLGATVLVLLMACANVANLLMSRTAARIREVGVRCALGASKVRIALQFLMESFLLALAGAVIGLVIGEIGVRLFNNAIAGTQPPFWIDIRIDGTALLLVLILTLLATFASGTLPALQAARANINEILKDEARGSSSFRIGRISRALVVLDIALSCSLLALAGLMIRSVVKLGSVALPFPTEDVLAARVALPELDYTDPASRLRFFESVEARLTGMPGVTSFTLTTALPGLNVGRNTLTIEGVSYANDNAKPSAARAIVTPAFFSTFGVDPLEGRLLTTQDRDGNLRVAVVNQSFARQHWPGESALGRRLRFDFDTTGTWLTIAGVVPDLYMNGVQNEEPAGVYVPLAQNPVRFMNIVARAPDPLALVPALREAVAEIDPDLPLYEVSSLAAQIREDTWFVLVFGVLFMTFGLVALLLASIGLYGVMSFSVGQRTREVGVRMALGARPRDVLAMIMRQGGLQLAVGLTVGLILAFTVSRFMEAILFNVSTRDPVTFVGIVIVLSATTGLACIVPARRATRVDPLTALRYE